MIEVFYYYIINNVDIPTGYFVLYGLIQMLFLVSSALFLGLFIWSINLYVQNKKQNPTSRKFLPRIFGFLFASLSFLTLFLLGYYYQHLL